MSIVLSFCLPKEIGKLSLTSKIFQDMSDEVARDMLLALFEKNDKITQRDMLKMRKSLSRDDLERMCHGDTSSASTSPIWTILASMYSQSTQRIKDTLSNSPNKIVDYNDCKYYGS